MAVIHMLLLMFVCWTVGDVYCQTFPYVSFMDRTLADHSYVDLSLVGRPEDGGESVQCITDLDTCCRGQDGPHSGDWYFPNGTRLPFSGNGDIYEQRDDERVDVRRRNSATPPGGVYRCDIPTNAVHDVTDISVRDAPVYVGLYTATGGKFNFHFLLDIS